MLRRLARLRPTTEARSLSCLCDHCPLAGQRPVPPLPSCSKLLILADSPGLDEDYAGYPFAGNVERFLRSTLKGLGLDLSTIHQTTAVLCLPKKKMRPAEWQRAIECCKPRLMAEIGSPRTVLAAGVHALSALTGLGKLTPWIGGPQVLASGTTVIPAPAFGAVIRNPAMLPVLKTFLARAAIGDLSWDWGQLVTVGPYAPHLERLMTEEEISVDIENSPASGRIRCIGVGSATLAVSVPLPPEGDATPEDLLMLRRLLASPIRKVLQNGQHDRTELKHHGWELNGPFFDTLLTHAVVAPRLPHDLGFMCAVEFAAPRWKTEFHVESDDKKSVRFDKAKLDELLTYNAKDNIMQARLAKRLRDRLATVHNGDALLAELEYLDNLTLQMREKGVAVNKAALDRHRTGLTVELERINKSFEDVLGTHSDTYKLGKNGQHRSLNKLFFDHFGAPPMEYSEETGAPSLNNKTLTYYIKKYTEEGSPVIAQIARLILEYREQSKLLGSYINNLPVVEEDGLLVVHPTWRTFGTRTGRWSAVDPAVQTLPKRLRGIFCARPGMAMVEADYSQLELRIVALLSGDRKLLDWYEAGLDVHAQNASEIFGQTWLDADPKKRDGLRKLAKNVVYGCVPMDTQALTRNGWKTYSQLEVGEEILTYNPVSNLKEWAPIEHMTYHASAEVWELSNRSWCTRSTPDHRWFVRQRIWAGRSWAKPYMSDVCVKTTAELNTESNIITNAPMADDLGLESVERPKNYLKYGEDWASLVAAMSTEARRAFLLGFMVADGHQQKQWGWCQNRGAIAEAALTASYLEHDGNIWVNDRTDAPSPMIVAKLSDKQHITGQRLQRRRLEDQPVWCPTTRNGSWVMRQGDTITITGNCNYGGGAKTIWGMLVVKTPGIQLAAIEYIHRRWFEEHPEIKNWQDRLIREAQERCYVEAPLSGRRQYYNDGVVVPTEVLNFPIQGTAGDLANMAIRRVYESGILPLAQIHDAVLAEGTDGLALARKLKSAMELEVTLNGAKTRFPCDLKAGPDWLNMKEVKL